jgi:cardiolipin synthase A/B
MSLRIVASVPATAAMFRLDQMVAALARRTLWLTHAYYAATSSYVQALTFLIPNQRRAHLCH